MDQDDILTTTISIPTSTATAGGLGGSGYINAYSLPSSYTVTNGGTYSNISYTTSASTNWATGNVNITTDGITMPANSDIKIGDKSLKDVLSKIEDRLAILTPDLKKLEKFEALKKAYENYKLLEKLCQEEDTK